MKTNSYLCCINNSNKNSIMKAINFISKTETSYKTKFGMIEKSNVISINENNQLVISDELFESLYSAPVKKTSLREANGAYCENTNQRYNHTTRRYENY